MAMSNSLVPAGSGVQRASETDQRAGAILRSYLEDVWIGRDADAVAKYFDEDVRFLAEARAKHRIDIDGLAEINPPIRVRSITSDATTAMAFCTVDWADGKEYEMFFLIDINNKGFVSNYRWMSALPDGLRIEMG